MQTTYQYLTPGEQERVHRESLRILAEVGVRFRSARARTLLLRAGAKAGGPEDVLRIPGELVAEALRTAPRAFTLAARNPAFDFALPSAFTGYTLDGAATFAADSVTGVRRYAVTADLVDSLRIFETLPLGTVVWPNVVLNDIPEYSSDVRTALLSCMHSSKHIQHEVHHPSHVPYILEGLAAILGGEDAIRRRPIFSVCYCTIPPLTHDDDMCDACLDLTEFNIPILPYPMPAAGSTGPAGLFSDIAVASAEMLSALVLFQTAKPGTPVIWGSAAGITNFRSGGFVEGAPESNLINGAMGDLARFHGLPAIIAGCLTDAQAPGPQAVMEKMFTTLPLVLAGVDVVNGIGEVGASQILVREQIVVDHELARLCRRMRDGIDAAPEKSLLDDVARVGPGGHFLLEDSTLAACTGDEFGRPDLAERSTYEQWVDLGRPDLYDKARARVRTILDGPRLNPLPDAMLARLEDLMRRADADLGE